MTQSRPKSETTGIAVRTNWRDAFKYTGNNYDELMAWQDDLVRRTLGVTNPDTNVKLTGPLGGPPPINHWRVFWGLDAGGLIIMDDFTQDRFNVLFRTY